MDNYWVEISGPELDMVRVAEICSDLKVLNTCVRGELFKTFSGKRRENVRSQKNHESFISFDSPHQTLVMFLRSLCQNIDALTHAGMGDIEVWALMQRDSQINGELSKEELKLLAKIGATYCWSVIVESDDPVSPS